MKIYVTSHAHWDRAESMMSERINYNAAFSCVEYTIRWSDFACCWIDNFADEYAAITFLSELQGDDEGAENEL